MNFRASNTLTDTFTEKQIVQQAYSLIMACSVKVMGASTLTLANSKVLCTLTRLAFPMSECKELSRLSRSTPSMHNTVHLMLTSLKHTSQANHQKQIQKDDRKEKRNSFQRFPCSNCYKEDVWGVPPLIKKTEFLKTSPLSNEKENTKSHRLHQNPRPFLFPPLPLLD